MNQPEKDSINSAKTTDAVKEEEFSFQPRFSIRKKVMAYYWFLTVVVFWAAFSLYGNYRHVRMRTEKFSTYHANLFSLYKQIRNGLQGFPPALQAIALSPEDNAVSGQAYEDVLKHAEGAMDDIRKNITSAQSHIVKIDPVRKYTGIFFFFIPGARVETPPDTRNRETLLENFMKEFNKIDALKDEALSIAARGKELHEARMSLAGKPQKEKDFAGKLNSLKNLEGEHASLRNDFYNKSMDTVNSLQSKAQELEKFEDIVVDYERKAVNWHGMWLYVIAGLMALAAPFIVVIAGAYTDKNFIGPVISLAKSAQEIAGGNLEHEANVRTGDEYEVLAHAFNTMKNRLKRIISYQQVQINKLLRVISSAAQGNLTQLSDIQTQDDFGKLSTSLNTMIENLRVIVESVESAIQQLIRSSQNISASAQTQSTEVSDQSVQITEIASSFQELSATAKSIADSAKKVSETSTKAAESAQSGEMAATKSIDAMKNINRTFETTAKKISSLQERSKNIGKVVTTIADLAEQINLLALNAAIEAARAGEHGKGFAVVADEVRKLAEKSSGFTEEIKTIITGVREETQSAVMAMEQGTKTMNEGVKLVTLAGEALKEITQLVEDVATHSREILYSTKQQHEGSEQVSTAVSSVSQTMRDIEFQARQTSSAAQSLVELAKSLEANVKDIVT